MPKVQAVPSQNTLRVRNQRKLWTPEQWEIYYEKERQRRKRNSLDPIKVKRRREREREYSKNNKEGRAQTRLKRKKWFDDYKLSLGGCVDCGYNECPEALDFDHLDPKEKKFEIGYKVGWLSKDRMLDEMNKCVVRCANCHRKRTKALWPVKYKLEPETPKITTLGLVDMRRKW